MHCTLTVSGWSGLLSWLRPHKSGYGLLFGHSERSINGKEFSTSDDCAIDQSFPYCTCDERDGTMVCLNQWESSCPNSRGDTPGLYLCAGLLQGKDVSTPHVTPTFLFGFAAPGHECPQ